MRPETLLVGDVGGTHARLGLVQGGRLGAIEVFDNDDFPSFEALIRRYLADRGVGSAVRAALAVAGPVTGDVVTWTNRAWSFSGRALADDLGLRELLVLNDFEAIAWSLPLLDGVDLRHLGGPTTGDAAAPRLVLGPGTGLGLSALVPVRDGWRVVATEAGHAGLAPGDARERDVLAGLHTGGRLVAEPVLSGPGLARLHAAVRAVDGLPPEDLTPEEIGRRGVAGADAACVEAVRLFCRLLGRFAGDAALTWGARGGVWLCSSICTGLEAVLVDGGFRDAFDDKATLPAYAAAVPTWLVRATHPALVGAAAALGATSVTR